MATKIISNKNGSDDYLFGVVQTLNNVTGYRKLSQCPEIILAVDRIADLVSNMTIHLMENTENGDVRVLDELAKKIDVAPCANMTRKQWMFFLVRTLLLDGDGNAIIMPEFDKNGYIANLWPVPASSFSFNLNPDITMGYSVMIGNKEYNPDSLIHFVMNPSMDNPYVGQSYRIQLRDLAKTLGAAQETKLEYMNGRYMPSVVVHLGGNDKNLFTETGKQKLFDKYVGASKAGAPWVVPANVVQKIETIKPLTLNDIAINESQKLDKEMVAALLGIPKFILGIGEFNAKEYNNFIENKILSIAKIIEQTLTQKILISEKRYFKFNIRSLKSYDLSTLSEVGSRLYTNGILTGNEVRDWLNLPPMEGLDELIALENFLPIDQLGRQKKVVGVEEENNGENE